jgi:N-acetylglucosamine-6-phosphate deacetylase
MSKPFRSLVLGFEKFVRIVALAPELPGAFSLLSEILRLGAIPALGHTDADYLTARKAVEAGASLFLHLFNAMRPFHHREPGAVGAALDTDAFVELIVDGYHLHPCSGAPHGSRKGIGPGLPCYRCRFG